MDGFMVSLGLQALNTNPTAKDILPAGPAITRVLRLEES
jgi:hypothetical protein